MTVKIQLFIKTIIEYVCRNLHELNIFLFILQTISTQKRQIKIKEEQQLAKEIMGPVAYRSLKKEGNFLQDISTQKRKRKITEELAKEILGPVKYRSLKKVSNFHS